MSHDNSANDPMGFMRNMWGNMGFSLPGMVTPSFDVEEIEKRVSDLKAVEGWLKMNLSMLQMTIQSLEMQCVTLNTVKAMSSMVANQPPADAQQTAAPPPVGGIGGEDLAQAAMWPWNLMQQMQNQMQAQTTATPAAPAEDAAKPAARRPKKPS